MRYINYFCTPIVVFTEKKFTTRTLRAKKLLHRGHRTGVIRNTLSDFFLLSFREIKNF